MIVGALLSLFGLINLTIIAWLPSATDNPIPDSFYDATTSIFNLIYQWDYILPINGMIALLALGVAFWVGMFGLKSVIWIVQIIRG